MKRLVPAIVLGVILILLGLGYRRYISKNENDFETPVGKLYGYSMILICGGVLVILLAFIMEINRFFG